MQILVVEDDPAVRGYLAEGLESHEGVRVDTSGDEGAVGLARERRYDVVIADMHLSDDLDALEIMRGITEFDDRARFILMTGKRRLDIATKLVQAIKSRRVSGFLFKPFDLEELYIAVHRARQETLAHAGAEPEWRDGFERD